MASVNNIEAMREARGWKRPQLAKLMGTTPQTIERLEKGQRRLAHDWIVKAANAFGVAPGAIITEQSPSDTGQWAVSNPEPDLSPAPSDPVDLVKIQHINLAFGLGSTFADSPVEVSVLDFPKVWVETITSSPPAFLTWTRGRGDSMLPTIDDGDLVLLDRSQKDVREQDALWAFTVGETASIKRLRVKGDRYQIFSDNPAVPPDEEPIDFVNIVARVVFIGRRT